RHLTVVRVVTSTLALVLSMFAMEPSIGLSIPTAHAGPNSSELTAEDIGQRVQAFYDKTTSFRASFEQKYLIKATGIEKKSNGEVIFEKPGKMSWRYKNNGNRVVSDGHFIRVYERDNRQMFESEMGKTPYPAALAFLVGDGRLLTSFTLRKLDAKQMKFEGGWVLEAKPKEASPAYQTMILYVDGTTAQVRRVLLLDAQGNRNRFDFTKPNVNTKVQPGEFTFAAPAGTQVIRQ
ncbi:MAG TPA: outer membrane lipoprotein carrier protein LolA, partial [Polyangiaceae bacterium]